MVVGIKLTLTLSTLFLTNQIDNRSKESQSLKGPQQTSSPLPWPSVNIILSAQARVYIQNIISKLCFWECKSPCWESCNYSKYFGNLFFENYLQSHFIGYRKKKSDDFTLKKSAFLLTQNNSRLESKQQMAFVNKQIHPQRINICYYRRVQGMFTLYLKICLLKKYLS